MSAPAAGLLVRRTAAGPWLAASAGLSELAGAAPAPVRLELLAEAADALNLPALVAAARATPGRTVALGRDPAVRAWVGGDTPPGTVRRLDPYGVHPTCALLDRDGTIMEDRGYLADPGGVTLLPGAAAGLGALRAAGIRMVVVTNQSGVARGLVTPRAPAAIHRRLAALLAESGVTLTAIYACPHGPEAACGCRKPADGMARQAAAEHGLDLARSIVVGDSAADLGLASRLGVPGFLVMTGAGRKTLDSGAVPADYVVDGLEAVARIVTHRAGLPRPEP